ncbi:MAG: hypothetical protein JJT76_10790, partial [Clostridiaceae bacterium]|nr:hypothetical protein [Clostridiaceae bacterium]
EPVYETRMVLMASNFSDRLQSNQIQDRSVDSILDSLSSMPVMTLETYRQQITAPRVMRKTIEDLGLEDRYDVESLARAISLETIRDTNLITIKMQHGDAEKAAEIVNKVGENFVEFVSDKAKEQATTSSKYVESQMAIEREKLDEALVELREFLAEPRSVEEMSQELSARLELITAHKIQLDSEEMKRDITLTSIQATERELSNISPILTTNKSILEDPLLRDITRENTDGSIKDIAGITVKNEEINPVYIELKTRATGLNIELAEINSTITSLKTQIGRTQAQIEELQIELEEKRYREKEIDQKVNLAQNTYDAFVKKYEELRVAESSQIGESSITVISRAFPTTRPVGPRKTLNVAIASVLGVMMGVFIAFFIEYWQTSAIEKKEEEPTN